MDASDSPTHRPNVLTDSPWFWLAVFSGMGLVALFAVGGRYARRQHQIEFQFQAREQVHQGRFLDSQTATRPAAEPHDFQPPGETMISLWPIQAFAFVVFLAAVFQLVRRRLATIGNSPGERRSHDLAD
jgi:hypothetical protein